MYQVILIDDEKYNKSYYYSYRDSDDETLGNITVDNLPPYQDIYKARACYYENGEWIFDELKHEDIIAINEKEKARLEEEKAVAEAALTNEEIAEALMELADMIVMLDERLTALEEE